MPDYYDEVEQVLWDYKTSGSYKVASAVGIVKEMIEDPTGAVYQRSGKGYSKGDPKMVPIFTVDPTKQDCGDWTLQLNRYCLFAEAAGHPVKKIKIEAIVRDGGTHIAKARGIDKNVYVIDIPILPDEQVRQYFDAKKPCAGRGDGDQKASRLLFK